MAELTLEVQGADGTIKASQTDREQVYLFFNQAYEEGDRIVLKSNRENVHLVIQLEDTINPAFVYFAGKEYQYIVPFNEKRVSYSPKSFVGEKHLITARMATPEEIISYKNLAKNEFDQHENTTCFPHASANVETRGESVFAARNAINGNFANHDHGPWPFESWGINRNPEAELTVHFGRIVEVDKVVLTLRADFPHDSYWERASLTFSDGSKQVVDLVKTHKPQTFAIEPRMVEWVKVHELIKADDPSPFPALTQLEVYGHEAEL